MITNRKTFVVKKPIDFYQCTFFCFLRGCLEYDFIVYDPKKLWKHIIKQVVHLYEINITNRCF